MKKKIIFLVIVLLLIGGMIIALYFVKKQGTPVEKFMEDKSWITIEEELKVQAEHNWTISKAGTIKCSHCQKKYKIGDIFNYTPSEDGEKIKLGKNLTGHDETQTITREEANWVVFGITEDGKGLLITTEKPLNQKDSIIFKGAQAYNNGIEALDTVARVLYSNSEYGFARCMSIEDVNQYLGYENPTTQYLYLVPVDTTAEEYDGKQIATEKWASIKNLTTKVKDIELFEDIIKNGTYTPDGKNTKEALGEYCINSYILQSGDKVENGKSIIRVFGTSELFEIDLEKRDFIFGTYETDDLYCYWLSSRGVAISIDFVAFGMSMIQQGAVASCVEMYDSRGETGLYYTADLKPGIRPVVELYVVD